MAKSMLTLLERMTLAGEAQSLRRDLNTYTVEDSIVTAMQ